MRGLRVSDALARRLRLKELPGTDALYTDEQAVGAWPNGTPVVKINSAPGDRHPDGSRAMIVGSVGPVRFRGVPTYSYMVLFDGEVIPLGIVMGKIRPIGKSDAGP